MKKLYFTIVFALLALVGNAQTNPNRVLIKDATGSTTGYLAERIEEISFAKVEGRVAADVEYSSFTRTDNGVRIGCKVTNTAACKGFRIAVAPTSYCGLMTTDAQKASYIERVGSSIMTDDFSKGANLDIPSEDQSFDYNTSYTIMTLGYDEYGIGCGVSTAEFTTPKAALVGNPSVTYSVSDVTTTSFKVTVTPNDDCYGYGVVSFDGESGGVEGTFQTLGSMWGYANIGQMIMAWSGGEHSGVETIEFKSMQPGSSYEVAIQPLDINGNYADYVVCKVKTLGAGGEGKAAVSVEVPASDFYKQFDSENNTWKYGQRVIFTPNDQTNIYRDALVEASYYDKDPEGYNKELLFPDQITAYTNRTGIDNDVWTVKPNTKYYAIAVGCNNNEEWGDVTKFEFTTPDASAATELPSAAKSFKEANTTMPVRFAQQEATKVTLGAVAPKQFVKKGITLTAK